MTQPRVVERQSSKPMFRKGRVMDSLLVEGRAVANVKDDFGLCSINNAYSPYNEEYTT